MKTRNKQEQESKDSPTKLFQGTANIFSDIGFEAWIHHLKENRSFVKDVQQLFAASKEDS